MKLNLKRFKHIGKVVTMEDIELDNGNDIEKPIPKFNFIYANIRSTISSQLSNLGNSQNSNRMVAVKDDTRFDKLIGNSDYEITLDNNVTYRITNISKDDSSIDPVYTISLMKNDAN